MKNKWYVRNTEWEKWQSDIHSVDGCVYIDTYPISMWKHKDDKGVRKVLKLLPDVVFIYKVGKGWRRYVQT